MDAEQVEAARLAPVDVAERTLPRLAIESQPFMREQDVPKGTGQLSDLVVGPDGVGSRTMSSPVLENGPPSARSMQLPPPT